MTPTIHKAENDIFRITYSNPSCSPEGQLLGYTYPLSIIIRPSVTYGYEIWPLTKQLEKKLLTFKNKLLRNTFMGQSSIANLHGAEKKIMC